MSKLTTSISAFLTEALARIEAVFNEVVAFFANLFHAIRGDVITHVVTPAESVVKTVVADAKTVVADVKSDAAVVAKQV